MAAADDSEDYSSSEEADDDDDDFDDSSEDQGGKGKRKRGAGARGAAGGGKKARGASGGAAAAAGPEGSSWRLGGGRKFVRVENWKGSWRVDLREFYEVGGGWGVRGACRGVGFALRERRGWVQGRGRAAARAHVSPTAPPTAPLDRRRTAPCCLARRASL